MTSPFDTPDGSAPTRLDRVTLVNGRAFVVAEPDGALRRPNDGLVFDDLRALSRFDFEIAGPAGVVTRELLSVTMPTPFEAEAVSRPDRSTSDGPAGEFYVHRQWVGRGVRHDIELHNTGDRPIERTVRVRVDTDFAHVFDMKAGRSGTVAAVVERIEGGIRLVDPDDAARAVSISVEPAATASDDPSSKTLAWTVVCPPRQHTTVSLAAEPWWDGRAADLAFPLGTHPSRTWPARRLDRWLQRAPSIDTNDARWSVAVEACIADLASLRIFDRDHTDRVVIAAGAPWFMTLFGRDSLLTSWMVMPFLPELAIGTLDTLADLQGTVDRPETEEQPGKILHELRRHGGDEAFGHRGRYYGTVDATPLFVMVAAEAHRWRHLDDAGLAQRWPALHAAIGWVRRRIADDPSGFLRYRRSTEVGLANQGWKDSWDGVSFADGELPTGAIALAEVQGYAHAALRDAAMLAERVAEPGLDPDELRREADRLAERFDAAFWDEAASSYVIALDGDDRRVDAVTTNPGHAIWAGICDPARADRYLDRIADDLFSGWGLRTLSPACSRYDPLSYHNGSVWPHDTAIVAAGAARAGRTDLVDLLVDAALDVAARSDGRPPELFAGIDREVVDSPVPYPSSCSPQAWASASTLLHLRSITALAPPAADHGAPTIGPRVASIAAIDGVRIGDDRFVARTVDGDWMIRPA